MTSRFSWAIWTLIIATVFQVQAATLTWDVDALTSGAQDGTGTWSAAVSNWWDGASNTTWSTANSNDVAVFGTGVGNTNTYVVSVPGSVTNGGLVFQDQDYSLNFGADQIFRGSITNNAIHAAIYGHINFISASVSLFNLNTNATLSLSNSVAHINDSYYSTIIGGGTLTVGGNYLFVGNQVSNNTLVVGNGGTIQAGIGGGIDGALIINSGGSFINATYHVFGTHNTIWINGGTLTQGLEYYVRSNNQMTGGYWYGNDARFDSGSANLITINPSSSNALINAVLRVYQGGTISFNVVGGSVVGGAYPGVDLEYNRDGGLGGSFGGGTTYVNKTGAGLMEITAPNFPMNGVLAVRGGTLRLTGVTSFSGSSIVLTNSGSVLQLNGSSPVTSFTLAAGTTLSKIGTGRVVLAPTAWTSSGDVTVQTGMLILGNNKLAGQAVSVTGGFLAGANPVGPVTVSDGGGIEGGANGAGSLTCSNLTFLGSGNLRGALGSSTPIVVTGGVATTGSNMVNITVLNLPPDGTYHFLQYGSGPSPFSSLQLAAATNVMTLVDNVASNCIDITVTNNGNYDLWTGGVSGEWSTNTLGAPKNWKRSTDDGQIDFTPVDAVVFDDTGANTSIVINQGDVMPGSVTFSNATKTYIVSGACAIGAGALTKNGAGMLTLNTTNNTGNTTINGGTLVLGNANAIGNSPGNVLAFGGGGIQSSASSTITFQGSVTASGDFAVNGGANGLIINGACSLGAESRTVSVVNAVTMGGVVSVSNLVKTGSGTLSLGGANTVNGGTTISGGQVTMNNVNAAGRGVVVLGDTASGSNVITLSANVGSGSFTNRLVVSSNGTGVVTIRGDQSYLEFTGSLQLNRATTLGGSVGDRYGYSGQISGNVGTLTVAGTPRITFDQPVINSNTFIGAVVINAGTVLQLATLYGLTATNAVTANGYLRVITGVVGGIAYIGALNGSGWVNGDSGGGNYLKNLALGGDNGNGTFGGIIYNGGGDTLAIVKNGSGTQTLTGVNTYSGGTIISNGVLLVNNTSGSATGLGVVNVSGGGTLGGTGIVAGAMTVQAGGTLAPGQPGVNRGMGRITVSNNVSMVAGSVFSVQLASNACDRLVSTGTLSLTNATLAATALDDRIPLGTQLVVAMAANITGTFAGLPEGGSFAAGSRRFVVSYAGNTNIVFTAVQPGMVLRVE